MSFLTEVTRLVSLHQEGEYWDFKRQWYERKSDLLHDIICMANNLCNHEAYIIIGVDEENGYSIVDVNDDSNRKNTQNIVDFLKDKKFAGGVRPLVRVEQVFLDQGAVDVIVIENSHNTPFYLTDNFERLCANHIYTRVMDTNTPVDRSADIDKVEALWKKRFYMDESPVERVNYYLKNADDWRHMKNRDGGYYYEYAPEYTITYEPDESSRGYEYYIFTQTPPELSWWTITIWYHQTAIGRFLGLAIDGAFVLAPKLMFDRSLMEPSRIGFFIENSLAFRLHDFFGKTESASKNSIDLFMRVILVFRSENEKMDFLEYVKCHYNYYSELCAKQYGFCCRAIPGYDMEVFQRQYRSALALQKLLKDFRDERRNNSIGENAEIS